MICSNLPVCFLSKDMLKHVLDRTKMDSGSQEIILRYYEDSRAALKKQLEEQSVHLVIPFPDKKHFETYASGLALADLFIDEEISLTYEEYAACTDELKIFANTCDNLRLELDPSAAFHNINISIIGDRSVIVSKENHPAIHFVIHHKKMVQAFRSFIPPITDR